MGLPVWMSSDGSPNSADMGSDAGAVYDALTLLRKEVKYNEKTSAIVLCNAY